MMEMPIIENLAVEAGYSMENICALIPDFMEQLARKTPLTYDAFVQQIDKDLNEIISITESGRQHHLDKGEDAITEHIISQLKQKYTSVHHDAQHGGHCDIYIEAKSSNGDLYKWIMEAKLWEGFEYVYSGLNDQLLESYAVEGINNCRGGMIFYSKLKSGVSYAMKEWSKGLEDRNIIVSNIRQDNLRFDTNHRLNKGNGGIFIVSHYCVELYHALTDLKLAKAAVKLKASK
ncbi:hypothetical protein MWG81_03175 [Proteus mirabilis]|uniref:hypothetical protein n=3 Tax=Proteus mirabilis TaxID=584 RepID=UPI001FF69916|nr:hypothetical protein [Proteus mirabilis]MCJ8514283.1 hypothetical protein [Proteus mirabilis]